MTNRRGVAVVGCGDISERYGVDIARQPHLRLVGACDVDRARAESFAAKHGCRVFASLDAVLADPEVEIVVNLTSHRAHVAVTRAALEAGRHVFSEKPLAVDAADAAALVSLADERRLLLSAAPIALLGELAQTARRWIDDGRLGEVRLAYAEVNWGRIETWHPEAAGFYDVGPLYDVGVYPLTLIAGLLGPYQRVEAAYAGKLLPERRLLSGKTFTVGAPDYVTAVLTTRSGAVVRLTANFYVADPARQRGVELHGDTGSLWLSNWSHFAGTLEHAPWGEPYRPVPLLRQPEVPLPWAYGVEDLAVAVDEGRRPRLAASLAAHVVATMESIILAARQHRPVDLAAGPERPAPADWAADLRIEEVVA